MKDILFINIDHSLLKKTTPKYKEIITKLLRMPVVRKDLSSSEFLQLGTELKGRLVSTKNINRRRFKAWYGIDWKLMNVVWQLLWKIGWMRKNIKKRKPDPTHLLWALSFLKEYSIEDVHAADVGVEAKTFRKWVWLYIEGIAELASRVASKISLCLLSSSI